MMTGLFPGAVAVIFVSRRTDGDDEAYALAAAAMERLAAAQPGYLGIDSARGADGLGITVSYWAREADAIAWRDHAEHAATRERGRSEWYRDYHTIVTEVTRSYRWAKD